MLKKILIWVGAILGALVLIGVIVVLAMMWSTDSRFNRKYTVQAETVALPTDAAGMEFGKRMVEIHCKACHGEDLAGGKFFEDPSIGYTDATNLTAGKGGIGATYTVEDWVRAIRHGVRKDGTSVFIMPSNDFYYLSDADVASIIAYVKTVPPVDREIRARSVTPFAKILYAMGAFGNLLYAEVIDHNTRPPAPPMGMTLEYGDYIININGCRSCHGLNLAGAQPAEPGAPFAPNLTPGGELIGWTEADFIAAMRTGMTPDGRQLTDAMPWQGMRNLTDEELKTVWMVLQAQPKLATNPK